VRLVGAALGVDPDDGTEHVACASVVGIALQLEFDHRTVRRNVGHASVALVLVVDRVVDVIDLPLRLVGAGAVDGDLRGASSESGLSVRSVERLITPGT